MRLRFFGFSLALLLGAVSQTYDVIDFDKARVDFDVNTLGPMRMVQAFMPHVMRSKQKKIINVTSLAAGLNNPMEGAGAMNYGASKAALNKYSQLLSVAVKEQGVIVGLFQPIFVASKDDLRGDNAENREALADIVSNAEGADQASDGDLEVEIAKFIKEVNDLTMKQSGVITNFTTGNVDPF
jgi:NAD(P)-dependent dehydrogenase (short-subunit alcohol dehydrogenase family)